MNMKKLFLLVIISFFGILGLKGQGIPNLVISIVDYPKEISIDDTILLKPIIVKIINTGKIDASNIPFNIKLKENDKSYDGCDIYNGVVDLPANDTYIFEIKNIKLTNVFGYYSIVARVGGADCTDVYTGSVFINASLPYLEVTELISDSILKPGFKYNIGLKIKNIGKGISTKDSLGFYYITSVTSTGPKSSTTYYLKNYGKKSPVGNLKSGDSTIIYVDYEIGRSNMDFNENIIVGSNSIVLTNYWYSYYRLENAYFFTKKVYAPKSKLTLKSNSNSYQYNQNGRFYTKIIVTNHDSETVNSIRVDFEIGDSAERYFHYQIIPNVLSKTVGNLFINYTSYSDFYSYYYYIDSLKPFQQVEINLSYYLYKYNYEPQRPTMYYKSYLSTFVDPKSDRTEYHDSMKFYPSNFIKVDSALIANTNPTHWIEEVQIDTFKHNSNFEGYNDQTQKNITVNTSIPTNIKVKLKSNTNDSLMNSNVWLNAYIDLDYDKKFDPSIEGLFSIKAKFLNGEAIIDSSLFLTTSLFREFKLKLGQIHNLRFVLNNGKPGSPQELVKDGEIEDYLLNDSHCTNDFSKPTFTTACPKNIDMNIKTDSTQVNWCPPDAYDFCSKVNVTSNYEPNNSYFKIGTTKVEYRLADLSGNFISCNFKVNITSLCTIDSITLLNFKCPNDKFIAWPNDSFSVFWDEYVWPFIDCNDVKVTKNHAPNDYFKPGITNVHYEIVDSFNTKLVCDFNVNYTLLRADLVVSEIKLKQKNINYPNKIILDYTLKNVGNYTTPTSRQINYNIYLSTDKILDKRDLNIFKNYTYDIDTLYTYQFKNQEISTNLNIKSGDYFIIIVIDPDNNIKELDESNNILVSSEQITYNNGIIIKKGKTQGLKGNDNPIFSFTGTNTDNSFLIAPNPAEDYIQVNIEEWDNQEVTLKVFNTLGVELQNIALDASHTLTQKVDIHALPSGAYYMYIQANEGESRTVKFIKR
jgi:hypothetical protein